MSCDQVEVLRWLSRNRDDMTVFVIWWIRKNGHNFENISEGYLKFAVDKAALNGHLDVLIFLHKRGMNGFTAGTMDHAASKGRLDVVRWLHENRKEGCTTKAMDSAGYGGHLDVVRWLHENRKEGCTRHGMQNATHRDILKTMRKNYGSIRWS
jgi:hypothetical protein